MKKLLLLLILITVTHNTQANPGSAAKLCMMVHSTKSVTSDCIVDLFNKRVVMQMSIGKEGAQEVCKNLKKTLIVYESYFNPGWVIHIMNYPNVEKRLALCHLPVLL